MPINQSAFYGFMGGISLIGAGVPMVLSLLNYRSESTDIFIMTTLRQKILLLVGIAAVVMYFVQVGFLAMFQAQSCGGVVNVAGLFKGGVFGGVITLVMTALAAMSSGVRLVVSEMFRKHVEYPAGDLSGNTVLDSDTQEFSEICISAAYLNAFAGAYGFGLGTLTAGRCKAAT